MYQLSEKDRAAVLSMGTTGTEGRKTAAADAAEAQVQRTLPAIVGLGDASDDATRQALLARTAAQQHRAFVALYGSPFGDAVNAEGISRKHDVGGIAGTHFLLDNSIVPA